jgi:hypothetical protein
MIYVPINEVVAEAISVVGVTSDDPETLKAFARQWIWRAVQDLPVTEDNIKVCSIDVKNLMMKKPEDMRRFLDIALYDENDCYIPHTFYTGKKRIFPEPTDCQPVDLSEDPYAFILGTNGDNVAYGKVRYFAYPIDSDGYPMIREEDVLTCVYYVRLCASMRKNDNRSEIDQNRQMYMREADRARAKRKSMNMSEDKLKTVAKIMNRMIPLFNRSIF